MKNAKVLIVEDEGISALHISRSLERYSYDVVGPTGSGSDAITLAKEYQPDIALMDITLEGPLDGIKTAAHLRDNLQLPIIFLTSHSDVRTLDRARIVEPEAYLLKPFEALELHAALQIALSKRSVPQFSGADRIENHSEKAPPSSQSRPDMQGSSLSDITEYLQSLDFFSELTPIEIGLFADSCTFQRVSVGTEILRAGKRDADPFIVASGRVSLFTPSNSGKELLVELLCAGDLLGLIAALERGPAPLTVRAQLDSSLLWIPRATFLLLLDSHPNMARLFCEYVIARLRRTHLLAGAIAHSQVLTRVANAIYSLLPQNAPEDSPQDGDGAVEHEYSIEISRQDLADITGSAVETIVRITKLLEKDKILKLGRRRKITVCDRARLRDLAKT
ncbi:MAG: response regulator [Bdellovibrionales bacterium]|nr:response regulator [Bdellovibrionales bacterium]